MLKKLSLGAAFAAVLATGALAQSTTPAQPGQPASPPAATAPAPDTKSDTAANTSGSIAFKSAMAQNEMLASDVNGMEVRNAAGEDLGDINDLVLDNTGKPSVAIIGVGGFLGIGEKAVGVPFDALAFADAQDGSRVARLDATKDALKAAPTYVYKDTTTTSSTGTGATSTSTSTNRTPPSQ